MKRQLIAILFGVVLAAAPAQADNRPAELPLFLRLNGVPKNIGVITTTGASTTNASTAVAFTIPSGNVIEVVCDADAFVNVGATSSTSYTNANFGRPLKAGVPRWFVLQPTDTVMSVAAAASVNCVFANMQ